VLLQGNEALVHQALEVAPRRQAGNPKLSTQAHERGPALPRVVVGIAGQRDVQRHADGPQVLGVVINQGMVKPRPVGAAFERIWTGAARGGDCVVGVV